VPTDGSSVTSVPTDGSSVSSVPAPAPSEILAARHGTGPDASTADAAGASDTAFTKESAVAFLKPLLDRNLRIIVRDGRMFWGSFKCTDPGANIVLHNAHEYRQPSAQKLAEAAREAEAAAAAAPGSNITVKAPMTWRSLGLVTIPWKQVVKVEKEQFASQMRKPRGTAWSGQ